MKYLLVTYLFLALQVPTALADDVPVPAPAPAAIPPPPPETIPSAPAETTPSTAQENPDCGKNFAGLVEIAERAAAKVKGVYSNEGFSGWSGINKIRDNLRRMFQRANKHDYPIVALDDGTSVNAYALAKNAYGELTADAAKTVNIDSIMTDLTTTLTSVEGYPSTLKSFIDDTSSMQAQVEFLEKYLEENKGIQGGIRVQVPVVTTDAKGKVTFGSKEEFWGTRIGLENALDAMKKELKARENNSLFSLNATNNIAMAQAINVRRLETFHDQLESQMVAHPGKPLPADLQAIYDRIGALYKSHRQLKEELMPPDWAWQRLNWLQLNREFVSLFQKDAPKLKDVADNNQLIQFIKNLTPEEQRAIGIGNAADAAGIFAQTKWVQAIVGLGTPTAAGGYSLWNNGIVPLYTLVVSDAKAKETCAEKTADADFISCAQAYLQLKFSPEVMAAILQNRAAFVNPVGNIQNKKVLAEVQDMIARHKKFVYNANLKNDGNGISSDYITAVMSTKDISSSAYRTKVISAPQDSDFIRGIMGGENPHVDSFLAFQSPLYFAKEKANILKALQADYGSTAQTDIMAKITVEAATLAPIVQGILDDRNNFKTGKPISVPTGSGSSTSTSTTTSGSGSSTSTSSSSTTNTGSGAKTGSGTTTTPAGAGGLLIKGAKPN